jgi:hypothetical protein
VNPDGRSLTNLRVEANAFCQPPAEFEGVFTITGSVAITASRTFTVNARSTSGDTTLNVQGAFDALNNVSGQFRLQFVAIGNPSGTRYQCDSGTVPFNGARQG